VSFLKEQAARLSAYMGDKHRFRLRSSSAMEAVAAIYRQPDWNTLQALSERGCAASVTSPRMVSAARFPRPMFWMTDDKPGELLSDADWFRHSVVVGGSKGQRESWLQQHFAHQTATGGAGVFLNVAQNALSAAERERCAAAGVLVNLRAGTGASLNLLSGLDPDEAASLICGAAGVRDYSVQGTDYWMQHAHYVLTVVIGAMQAAKRRVSLSSLLAIFGGNVLTALQELSSQLTGDNAAQKTLDVFVDVCRGNSTRSHVLAVVIHALDRLHGHRWAHQLFSDDVGAQGLYAHLSLGRCLLIETPDDCAGYPEVAVLYSLRHAVSMRLASVSQERQQDWVFGFGEVQHYCRPVVGQMVSRARSARVAFLFTFAEEPPVTNSAPPFQVGYAHNQLYLDGRSPSQLQAMVETMANRPLLIQPGRLTALD
jgi:hypothetical protein